MLERLFFSRTGLSFICGHTGRVAFWTWFFDEWMEWSMAKKTDKPDAENQAEETTDQAAEDQAEDQAEQDAE